MRNDFDLAGGRIVAELHPGRRRGELGQILGANEFVQVLGQPALLCLKALNGLGEPGDVHGLDRELFGLGDGSQIIDRRGQGIAAGIIGGGGRGGWGGLLLFAAGS